MSIIRGRGGRYSKIIHLLCRQGGTRVDLHPLQTVIMRNTNVRRHLPRCVSPEPRNALPALHSALSAIQGHLPATQKASPALRRALRALRRAQPMLQRAMPALQCELPALWNAWPALRSALPTLRSALPALRSALSVLWSVHLVATFGRRSVCLWVGTSTDRPTGDPFCGHPLIFL